MKFVCENCKAKYQIGDEKVAGKTVRMKCRRCGHMIQVSSSMTESSVSRRPPAPPPAPAGGAQGTARGVRAPGVPAPPRARPEPPRPPLDDEATMMMAVPPGGGMAGRRLSSAPPPPRSSAAAARATAGLAATAAAPVSGGMAAAFAQAVAAPPAVASATEIPADDWYVGMGGVPLGPVRLSVIREKAASGAVDGDSLVWREGYDEWQPIKNFPHLLELVTEAASKPTGRRTFTPAPMQAPPPPTSSAPFGLVRQSRPPPPAGALAAPPKPAPPKPAPPKPAPPAPAATDSAPSLAALGTAAAVAKDSVAKDSVAKDSVATESAPGLGVPAGGAVGVLPDPFGAANGAAAPEKPKTNGAHAAAVLQGEPAPAVVKPEIGAPESVGPSPESIVAGKHRKRGLHPMAYAFIAMAAAFGAVVAYKFVLGPQEVVVVGGNVATGEGEVGAHAPPPPPEVGGDNAAVSTAAPGADPGDDPKTLAGGGPVPGGGVKGSPGDNGKGENGKKKADGSQSSFDTGVGGPSLGPSGSGAGETGGGQLSEGEIRGVVNRNTPRIRRKCWEPAYAGRSKKAPKSATVRATITISGSGNVQSVSVSGGGRHFPGLASCVQANIGAWRFPASGGTTKTAIPFSFVSQ